MRGARVRVPWHVLRGEPRASGPPPVRSANRSLPLAGEVTAHRDGGARVRRASGLRVAGPASLLLHLALLAGLILWAAHRGRTKLALSPLDQGVKVKLVLEEHKGVRSPAQPVPPQKAHPPRPPARSAAQPAPAPPKPKPAQSSEAPPPLPTPPEQVRPQSARTPPVPRAVPRAVPRPVPRALPRPLSPPATPSTAPPAQRPAPQMNLGNLNDNETNALVTGDAVVPAKADDRYHNREPDYPPSAVLRGEQGGVELLIHVGPDGRAQSVDVLRSSGYAALDRAARQAVLTWHFLPALKHGLAVPAAMPLRVVFRLH